MVMPFVSKVNAELFCEAMNAENERREADTVKHGVWVAINGYHDAHKCSVCETWADDWTNYCPYCGAKMDGDEKNG